MNAEQLTLRAVFGYARQVAVVCVAILLFVLEVLTAFTNVESDNSLLILLSSAAIMIALVATGFFVLPGGIAVVTLAVAQNVFVSGATMGMLAVYVVVALWISRGMWLPSTLALILAEGSALIWSTMPEAQILSLVLGTSITIIAGLLIRYMTRRNKVLESDLKETREQSEEALNALRQSVNNTLHDDVASRLVAAGALVERLKLKGVSGEDLNFLKSLVDDSLTSVRAMVQENKRPQSRNLSEIVPVIANMLTSRSMSLDVAIAENARRAIEKQPIVALFVWEGCMNALKYGVNGSSVSVTIEETSEDRVTATIKNLIGNQDLGESESFQIDQRVSSGYGLRNLETQITASGGQLASWISDGRDGSNWILMAELPVRTRTTHLPELEEAEWTP